jgi:DNA polymerase I-like protein with 3'-5' exonuclease and polymerase domains
LSTILLPKFDLTTLAEYDSSVKQFFSQFPELENFRSSLEALLYRSGEVRSINGNHRRRTSSGSLAAKEIRWAMSQVVQGTASLIFKEAVIGLRHALGIDSILLPMHDAVLLQFDPSTIGRSEFVETASRVMEQAFSRRCPDVTPKIREEAFARY